jgi:glycosyltransferase involved in cell wall biosynthesis
MSRVRLLAVISTLDGGGAERQMVLLLKHLDRSRFEPTLCLLSNQGPFRDHVPADVPVVSLEKGSRGDAPRVVAQLARLVRQTRPHVILSKLDYTNIVAALANGLSRTSTQLVVVEEAVLSLELPDTRYQRLRRALLQWSYRRSATVVAPSPGVAADLRDNVGVRAPAFDVIPNMVDISAVQRAAKDHARHRFSDSALPLIATMGRLTRSKGQGDLLCAIALLHERCPCNLLLVGDGDDRGRLETMAHDLGIADHVAFAGFLANPFALVVQADVFISPSYRESFGNAIIEAMALEVPVISTRIPCGPEQTITDGLTGIFAAPGDPRDLAQKIELILSDSVLSSTIAAGGRKLVQTHYDADTVVARYERLLERVALHS